MFPKKTIPMLFLAIEGDRREVSPYSSRIHRNHSALLIAIRPSFSTVYCKTLNIFIKVCYSLPCIPALSPERAATILSGRFRPRRKESHPIPAVFLLSARFDPLLLLNV